jgi:GntR family histidine utilization transcriptional repressor
MSKPNQPPGVSAGASQASGPKVAAFQRIKDYVLERILSGEWVEGATIPGEEALARTFAVSRMTVNRAFRELSVEGVLHRVQGSGTFVAQRKYQSILLEIRNIADEVAARGHAHRSDLQLLERCRADDSLALQFNLPPQSLLFHSVVVHFENELAIQVEDRYVNPLVAPDYLTHDFESHTPNEYLMRVAPLQGVRFTLEACMPPPPIRDLLACGANEPCVVLKRQTLSLGHTASCATMWHPASRYQFAGSF